MKNNYRILGLMSGTSLDGLDLAICSFTKTGNTWEYNMETCKTVSYTPERKKELQDAIFADAVHLLDLHHQYGIWLGNEANQFLSETGIAIDAIASHGHTIHHQPQNGFTFQLGDGQTLAITTKKVVISDFRSKDIALGGQGAPLIPIGDEHLFNDYTYCLNLGGISNISFSKNGTRLAYDIGIANMALNHITQQMGIPYDDEGKQAATGSLNEELYAALNALPYYTHQPPKSTGYEWFTAEIEPLLDQCNDTYANKLHTIVHHIAKTISDEIHQKTVPNSTCLVTGGGALNLFLLQTLQQKLRNQCTLHVPSKELIDFKEALIFAFMGVLRLNTETNVLHSVTGARQDSCSGMIYHP